MPTRHSHPGNSYILRIGFQTPSIAEVAVRRTLHDRLRARESYARIVAFAKTSVALAGEQRADFRQPHVPVHFRIAAARNVEGEDGRAFFAHRDVQRAAACPQRLNVLEAPQSRPAALRLRHRLSADDENDFQIQNQADMLAIASDVSGILSTLLGSIGAVSLLSLIHI